MHALMETVMATIRRHALLEVGDNVFVALSGGADSVTLLYILSTLRDTLSLSSLHALHVHHGLRGDAADRDEAFVRRLCKQLDIPLTVSHVDVHAYAGAHHQTLEEAGRTLRYAFFEEEASKIPNAKIATAHTLDDTAETVLLNLSRGCGLRGASGIPVKRGIIVRPLIDCTADQVRTFCAEQALTYCVDETNTDERFSRNRIRLSVLPQLSAICPDAARRIAQFAQIAKEENDFLDRQASVLLETARSSDGFRVDVLQAADSVLSRRALILAAREAGDIPLEKQHINALLTLLNAEGCLNLPQNRRAVVKNGVLTFDSIRTTPHQTPPKTPVLINKTVHFGNECYELRLISAREYTEKSKIHKNLFYFCLSYDMIGNDLCLRSRCDGDSFRPFGRGCRKTLKKWFQEIGIPSDERPFVPLVADEKGILAVLGHAVDERAAVTDSTTTVLWFKRSLNI